MMPNLRQDGEQPPDYGGDSDLFTIEVHHGGIFVGHGKNRAYLDEKVNWIDYCDKDSWSCVWIWDFVALLGYDEWPNLRTYWLLPGKDLSDGLRIVESDADALVMASVVDRVKNLIVYFDHEGQMAQQGKGEMKKGMEKKEKFAETEHEVPDNIDADQEEAEYDSDDSILDSDFVDSDYEVDDDDDDLYDDNIDPSIDPNLPDPKAKSKKAEGSKLRGHKGVVMDSDGEDCDSDEGLQLPDSDSDGDIKFNFKSFKPEDASNPVFRVGMVFPSVEVLRKAINEYSIKNRVSIKLPRNDSERNMYASLDKRAKAFMIKTFEGKHNCQKVWVNKRCTSKWLADKYMDTFRAKPKEAGSKKKK